MIVLSRSRIFSLLDGRFYKKGSQPKNVRIPAEGSEIIQQRERPKNSEKGTRNKQKQQKRSPASKSTLIDLLQRVAILAKHVDWPWAPMFATLLTALSACTSNSQNVTIQKSMQNCLTA